MPTVDLILPEGWAPGRCQVRDDIEKSCPFSFRGCYVYKPEMCPIVKLMAGVRIVPNPKIPGHTPAMPKGWKFKTTCYRCKYIHVPQMGPPCDNCVGVDGHRRNYKPGGRK